MADLDFAERLEQAASDASYELTPEKQEAIREILLEAARRVRRSDA